MTAEVLGNISTELASNVALIVPVAITVFALMQGVKLVPKIIKKFM